MNSALREKAINLRVKNQLSYSEIRSQLKVSKSTLSYWLREMPLSKEKISELRKKGWSKGEASRERFRATMREKRDQKAGLVYEKQLEKLRNLSSVSLYVAGLMIYLGEGDKKNNYRIGLANTDPFIIKFFIKWLVDFMDVRKDKIRAELHFYENMDFVKEKNFWKKELGFKDSQFYKTQIRKLVKNSFSYSESFRHGTCSLFLQGAEKKTEVMMAIKAFLDIYKD
jgi:hypothetical protein